MKRKTEREGRRGGIKGWTLDVLEIDCRFKYREISLEFR